MAKNTTSNDMEAAYSEALGATSPAVATPAQNAELVHSDPSAPESTRDDYLDAGVPMLPGSPSERQGPEDALGIGPKRGDYTSRVGPADYNPHISVRDPESGRNRLVPQRALAEQIGEVPGVKGGVDTNPGVIPGAMPNLGTDWDKASQEMRNKEMGLSADGGNPSATPAPSTAPTAGGTSSSGVSTTVTRESGTAPSTAPDTDSGKVPGSVTPQTGEPGSGVEALTHKKNA